MADLPEPGYRLKLRRAKEHLDAIEMEARTFTEHNLGATVSFDPQPEDEWTIIRRGTVDPPTRDGARSSETSSTTPVRRSTISSAR